MALVTVYDADGVEYQKENIDARECVAELGFTYSIVKPKVEVVEVVEVVKAPVAEEASSSLGRPKKAA